MKSSALLSLCIPALTLLVASPLLAQVPPPAEPSAMPALSDRPDADASSDALGKVFESPAAGIAFRAPANCKEIRKAGGDTIVTYVNDANSWLLEVRTVSLSKPMPLVGAKDPTGHPTAGLIDTTLQEFKANAPSADVLRQDIVNVRDLNVGMLAMRYTLGTKRNLTQEAIIQATEQLYYVFSFTTPGAKAKTGIITGTASEDVDPAERRAVEVFQKVLDSVKLLDRAALRDEQNERLFRTRAFYVNLSEPKIKAALVPEQYLRLLRDGKDIGYTYLVEDVDQRGNAAGISISTRAYSNPEPGHTVSAESSLFCSFDRKHETWATVANITGTPPARPGAPASLKPATVTDRVSEVGTSDRQVTRALDANLLPGDGDDKKQPPVREGEVYTLTVTHASKSATAPPVVRDLPPFYLPQALGQLLPSLLPRNESKTFLFATYASDQREIMLRYVDVGHEQNITLGSKTYRAVPITERLGYEGAPTTHYVSPEGKYLGSINPEAKITILVSDAETIAHLWPNANLQRPNPDVASQAAPIIPPSNQPSPTLSR